MKVDSGYGNVEICDIPEPECGSNDVKVEIKYTGICGTDLHIFHDSFKTALPVVIGHEFSGTVVEIGSKVKELKKGDRVTVLPSNAYTCGECNYCKEGYYVLCSKRKGLGLHLNGGFTKNVVVREDMVYKIPDHVSFEVAALAEPLAVAIQPIEELAEIKSGETVLVSGPGPIGLICASLLVAKGCKVIVSGTALDNERLTIAKKLNVELVIDVATKDLVSEINKVTNNNGVDVVIECSGNGAAISSCLKALKKMGTFIQVGIVGSQITLDYDMIVYKQIKLIGSIGHTKSTWDKVIDIFSKDQVNLKDIITHRFPLSKWQEAFNICEGKQCGKVLLYYDYDDK